MEHHMPRKITVLARGTGGEEARMVLNTKLGESMWATCERNSARQGAGLAVCNDDAIVR